MPWLSVSAEAHEVDHCEEQISQLLFESSRSLSRQCLPHLRELFAESESVLRDTGADDVVRSNIRETLLDVFGPQSPESTEHEHIDIWSGGMYVGMSQGEIIAGTERGKRQVQGSCPIRS